MASLTSTQRTDLQADLGISSDEAVFTNTELDRLYTRAGSDYNKTVVLAVRQLLMNAAKFNDYTAGDTQEKKSQVFKNLKQMYDMWSEEADDDPEVKIVGMVSVPPKNKDKPST